MAKVLGESGKYVSQEAVNQSRRILLVVILVVALLAILEGFILASYVPSGPFPAWLRVLILVGTPPGIWILYQWGDKTVDVLLKPELRNSFLWNIQSASISATWTMKTLLRRSRIYIAESAVVSVVRRELRFDFGVRVKKREAMRRGAVGEIHVGNILTDFPDDFCVKLVSPNAAPASVMLDRIEIQRKNPHESRPRKRL